jgi:hypothetical protein
MLLEHAWLQASRAASVLDLGALTAGGKVGLAGCDCWRAKGTTCVL